MKHLIPVRDINEASYYLLKGGKIMESKTVTRSERRYAFRKKVNVKIWKFKILVDEKYINSWWSGKSTVNIRQFVDIRTNIKRQMYEQEKNAKVNTFIHHI